MSESQYESERGIYILGGEGRHRGFWGTQSKSRGWGTVAIIGVGMVFTPALGWVAIVSALVGVTVLVILTSGTHNGSIIERRRRSRRHQLAQRTHADEFIPYDADRAALLTTALEQTNKTKDKADRAGRIEWARELNAMRANPDGCDGMGWLQSGRGVPGIAWHGPTGEEPYLSVAFSVSGQLRGMESSENVVRGAEAFGAFQASKAAPGSLMRMMQSVTRVLPADTALQEFWVLNNIDEDAPDWAKKSYEEVLIESSRGAMVQRHYVVGRWPVNARFVEQARKYGTGRDGWRKLMAAEIESFRRGLLDSRHSWAEPLTARGTAAVIRHMQNPSRPLDLVRDMEPTSTGERARGGEYSAHVVEGIDPESGEHVEWWHRTAVIRAESLTVAQRRPLWLLELLVGRELDMIRTVSFHVELIPAGEARHAARRDLVSDMAAEISETSNGKIPLDEGKVKILAAQRRRSDLAEGSGHHGANWVGFITITTDSRDRLASASRELAEVCANEVGIQRLEWLDSYQAAASGTTWPIARGLRPHVPTFGARAMRVIAGGGDKEAIA
ncbi:MULTISPECIES: SCO6880 family protein [Microbacterium]|uniref:SCO6880 family protein n=1 Tax=Microbacterium TaxID=33882 RepID=UPI0022AE8199|nr:MULTISPECIES: SCO6880 family protein [Microbacterium]MCZ4069086.1 hypothetical protein [Microbacterium sp. H37-C3]WHE37874.1 hypothetical protein P6897_16270 [Microbacterium sp. BDGP8]WRK17159.1 SCO6880 family protein [Microbacterium plantarum]